RRRISKSSSPQHPMSFGWLAVPVQHLLQPRRGTAVELMAEPGTNLTCPGFSSQDFIFFPLSRTKVDAAFLQARRQNCKQRSKGGNRRKDQQIYNQSGVLPFLKP
uniref:Uncharacterized protein n=1 Tax=Athene cunicularia TaxID=194338 RepID=A0A663LIB9_ATHCN